MKPGFNHPGKPIYFPKDAYGVWEVATSMGFQVPKECEERSTFTPPPPPGFPGSPLIELEGAHRRNSTSLNTLVSCWVSGCISKHTGLWKIGGDPWALAIYACEHVNPKWPLGKWDQRLKPAQPWLLKKMSHTYT